MHLLSKHISTALILIPFAATISPAISPVTSECVRSSSRHAASKLPCGNSAVLGSCLSALGESFLQTDIEACYINAGCGPDEAVASAIEILTGCVSDHEPEPVGDLKKRQDDDDSDDEDEEDTDDEETETETTATSTADETTTTEAETTDETTTAEETDDDATETETTEATTTTSADTTAETTASTITDCLSTTTLTTETCTTETGSAVCSSVEYEETSCRDGLYCSTSSSGTTSCFVARNYLTTGGIIVAVVFLTAIVLSIALITFFCCRDKSQAKKLKAKMEAAAIAKESAAGKKSHNVSDRQPLMTNTQEGYAAQSYDAPQQDGMQNPFQEQTRY